MKTDRTMYISWRHKDINLVPHSSFCSLMIYWWFEKQLLHCTTIHSRYNMRLLQHSQREKSNNNINHLCFILVPVSSREVFQFIAVVCFLVASCPSNRQYQSVGQIYSHNRTCCHTETDTADQTCSPILSQYTDTKQSSPSPEPMSGAKQVSL